MSVEGYLAWVHTLRGKRGVQRLAAVLRHYPMGAPMEAVRTLMNNLSRRALDRLVDEAVRQEKVVFVHLVDTTCALIEDEGERRKARHEARLRLRAWCAEGRLCREGTREQKLLLWQGRVA